MMELFRISVGNLSDEVAIRYSEKEALVDISERKRLSYRQFLALTKCISSMRR